MAEKKYIIDNSTLMAEWDWEKNRELNLLPEKLTLGSGKKVWWKCSKGHKWLARIHHRSNGVGCPFCLGRYAIKGENDLATLNPDLSEEWNYEKNNRLTPADVLSNSGKKVWWKCKQGHEWQATIASRNYGTACPVCNSERHTSFPEYALVYYLKKCGLDVIHSYKEKGYELDIYIPSKKIAIEYDGGYWHKNREKKDLEKNRKCKRDGIQLYRIREELSPLNDTSIDYIVQNNQVDLEKILKKILSKIFGENIEIDLKKDAISIENLRVLTEKENSLLWANPELAKEWNYEKNGKLKPENFAKSSGKKVWWKCKQGHEYRTAISNRSNGRGCPYCAGQKVLKGYNDLATLNPLLIQEWNYEKNEDLKPEQFTTCSGKKVWWKCRNGHEWETTVISRNKGGGCPYCLNQKLLKGYNDLATRNPELAKEWDYELNIDLTPCDVFPNGHQKVWWKCDKGHKYLATLTNRSNDRGCPYCSSNKVLFGETDLATINPKLATEWDYTLNKDLTPSKILPNSNKKVWWKCRKGHKWQAVIANRNGGMGCPYCAGQKVLKGYNDLATLNPLLIQEWNYDKNANLKPEQFTISTHKKVWWRCQKGHEWFARIDHRNNGSGCPECAKQKRMKNKNKKQ